MTSFPNWRCVLDKVRMYFGQNPQDFDEWHLRLGRARLARAGQNPKMSYHFLLWLPPHPPPRSGKFEWKEIFGFASPLALVHYIITLWYTIPNDILWIMQSESTKLGLNLKKIRTKKGISQGDIARDLEVSRGFISTIENGKTNPTLATIAKLAKAVGVSVDELLK